ncbi:hypothetical protein CPB86DRAFT_750322 [Serendipita vermifera]|nr:hypothetical protein CPB86DRAFT_750322 [Serendipita vermifera]
MPSRLDQLRAEARSVSSGAPSIRSNLSGTTIQGATVQPPISDNRLELYLSPGDELPTVPYKLRFAISPDEWDKRIDSISLHTAKAAKPVIEGVYFFFFCIAIPAGIAYPIYLGLLELASQDDETEMMVTPTVEDKMDAIIIPSVLAVLLFMMFSIPLFLRKYVLQRRLNEETKAWMRIDLTKVDKKVDVRWRVRLPFVFGSTSAIRIPVPPRMDDSELYSEFSTHSHSRTNSWEEDVEALGGAGLARSDSMGRQSMFEGEEANVERV